jgi:Leucine Rich repeat
MSGDTSKSATLLRRKRRWLSFSLRTLFLLVTGICLIVGWEVVPILEQKRAINSLKGVVPYEYDYQFSQQKDVKGELPEPSWLAKLLGVDSVHDVVKVDIFGNRFNTPEDFHRAVSGLRHLKRLRELSISKSPTLQGQDLESIANLRELERLSLCEDRLEDGALQNLCKLERLQTLALMWNRFSGEGLASLGNLHRLEAIDLYDNQVTDAGLSSFSKIASLKYLCLEKNQITDDGLKYLAPLTNLEYLQLAKNRITGKGLPQLMSLSKLTQLILDDNPISDQYLKSIVRLPSLQSLSLARTNISDASIEFLAQLPAECAICITGTHLTDEGIGKLQRLRPNSAIYIQGDFDGYDPNSIDPVPYSPPSNQEPSSAERLEDNGK